MPSEGSSVSFDIVNTSGSTKTFYWYIRESSGDIRWTDFDGLGVYSESDSTVKGTRSVAGNSTAQVLIDLKLDTLVEEEESFDIIVSDTQLDSSQIQASASIASYSIQDATTGTIVTQSSSAYSTATESIRDYDIPGSGSLDPSDFNWRSVSKSELFYVSPDAVVLQVGGYSSPPKLELALKDSSQTFRKEYTSQEIKPNGITYDSLWIREATADTEGNIYAIVTGDQDEFTSVYQQKDFLIKIDDTGNIVFTQDLSETTLNRTFQALYSDGSGGIIVASYADEPYPMPRIDRYDAETGNIIWSQKPVLGMGSGSIRMSERPIQLLDDGSFLLGISGYVGVEDPVYSTYIIRMDIATGTSSHMLGIDQDATYFQNEFIADGDQLVYRTKFGVYEVNTGSDPKDFAYPLSSYVPPSTGVGGGGGSSSSPAATTPTTTAPSTPATSTPPVETPATSPTTPVTPTPTQESPVLGIQPQETVTTVQLSTLLTLGNLQVTQAVVGTPQNDVITGSDEGEAIAGGKGKDQMNGGGGPDAFVFETPGEFGKKSADVITDFNPDEGDKVAIASDAFDGISRIKFTSVTGKGNAKDAASTNKTFIYDEKKGVLYFNQNGRDDGFGDGGEFVKLTGAPEIGKGDFVIV